MIVVLGRPRVHRPDPSGELAPTGLAVEIALALGRAGSAVELVGSIGDDAEGDRVVVELGRAGVGHAALLRDPAARTPSSRQSGADRRLPRLEAADVELGLRYQSECRVLVVAEPLDPAALAAALAAGEYNAAATVVVAPAGTVQPDALGDGVTLLETPSPADQGEDGEDDDEPATPFDEVAFARLVAGYVARLDRGEGAAAAFAAALDDSGWEPSTD